VHWDRGGEPLEAARWSRRAAIWAGPIHADETLRHWRRVRELAASLPDSPETLALCQEACAQILNYSWRVGLPDEELHEVLASARELAQRSGDMAALTLALAAYGTNRLLSGQLDEWFVTHEEVMQLTQSLGDRSAAIGRAAATVGLWLRGDLRASLAAADEVIAETDATFGREEWGFSTHVLNTAMSGLLSAFCGELSEGRRRMRRAEEVARRHDEIESLGYVYALEGWITWLAGDGDNGLEHAMQGVEIAERLGSAWSRSIAWASLARVQGAFGDWEAADAAASNVSAIARERGIGLTGQPAALGIQAEAALHLGDTRRSLALAQEAVSLAARYGMRVAEAIVRLVHAEALVATSSSPVQAVATLDRCAQLIDQAEATALLGFLHSARASVARATGDRDGCQRETDAARRRFAALGATRRLAELSPGAATL
jgi:hypothetical protein